MYLLFCTHNSSVIFIRCYFEEADNCFLCFRSGRCALWDGSYEVVTSRCVFSVCTFLHCHAFFSELLACRKRPYTAHNRDQTKASRNEYIYYTAG